MINLLNLSQLEHKARIENNDLALIILEKMEEELEESVENALTTNDADYSYDVFDAVNAVEFLIDCTWYRADDTKQTKDKIVYKIETLHEDTSPYNNDVTLWKYKGSESWTIETSAGQYGEQQDKDKFEAKGFKEAQELATKKLVCWIKKGLELNIS